MAEELGWDTNDEIWSDNPYNWDDIILVEKIVAGGGTLPERYDKLTDEEKEHFIQLIVKVKGNQEYSVPHIYTETKSVKVDEVKVTAEDIKLVVKEVLGINLEINNINV
jgi:hypothetical protein